MKIKFALVISILLAFSVAVSAQTKVKITPKKVVYKRTDKNVPDHKKTFEITYPMVSGNGPIEEIKKSLSYWKHFETDLEDITVNYWTSEMRYEVDYNDKGILDIKLIHSGSGAYPSDHVENLIIDLSSGRILKIKDAFMNRNSLYPLIVKAHEEEMRNAVKENEDKTLKSRLDESAQFYSIYEIRDFKVNDKGVTFLHDYQFSHVNLALEPAGEYFFTWEQMKPFIDEYSPFGKFLN